jgi:hypothetical protein
MYHLVNNVDCEDFSHTARAPMTNAKQEMIELTRTDLEGWLSAVRSDPEAFCRKYGGCDLTTVAELKTAYDPDNSHRVTAITFARKLKEMGIPRCDPIDKEPGAQIRVAPNGDLVRLYALRNADKWTRATTLQLRKHYEDSRKLIQRPAKTPKF